MDNLNARAELEVIVKGLDKAVGQFEQLFDATGDRQFDKYGRTVARVSGQLKGASVEAQATAASARGLAAAQATANAASEEAIGALPRLRYALYDVATTAGVTGAAITAAGVATSVLSAQFESAFTSVERTSRTSGAAAAELREQLLQITRDIPVAFTEISQIATLGAQLDIAAEDLAGFSETVAQFASTAGTTVDATASGFGRIAQLLDVPTDQFNQLGSAILYAGNTSVATEQDVLNYAQRLSIVGNEVGLTADQVVALSATLSSLGIGLEASQGATQRVFQQIQRDIGAGAVAIRALSDAGGEMSEEFVSQFGDAYQRIQNLAAIANMSAEEFSAAWNSPDGPQGAISSLIEGLSRAGDLTAALDSLGIVETREVRLFTALANNVEFYNTQLRETNQAYQEGAYLADSYGLVVDDLASRWQIFVNALSEAGAAVGDVLAVGLKPALDFLSQVLIGLTNMAEHPIGQWAIGLVAILGGVVAVLAAIVTGAALTVASMAALRTAMVSLNIQSAASIFTLRGLSAAATQVGVSMGLSTTSINGFKLALASTGIGLAVVAFGTLAAALMSAGDAAETTSAHITELAGSISSAADAARQGEIDRLTEKIYGYRDSVLAALEAEKQLDNYEASGYEVELGDDQLYEARVTAESTKAEISELNQALFELYKNGQAATASGFINDLSSQLIASGLSAAEASKYFREFRLLVSGFRRSGDESLTAAEAFNRYGVSARSATAETENLSKAIGGSGGGGGLAKQVRTLVDYANDLQGVFQRAFDIRFGGQQGLDAISTGWNSIAEAAEAAREEAEGYRSELAMLAADRDIKEYWLSVAENYGDTLRATKLRAELAEIDEEQTSTQKKLTAAQEKNNKTLEGNSSAAIENRSQLLGLVGNYQTYIQALAASGMSQEDLQSESQRLRSEFVNQAVQMGYNRQEVERYAQAFNDISTIIRNVPRNVTVTANVDPALQALAEYEAALKRVASGSYGGGTIQPPDTGAASAIAEAMGKVDYYKGAVKNFSERSPVPMSALDNAASSLDYWVARLRDLRGYKDGGYTGNIGSSSIAGFVHGNEYVMSTPAVRNVGVNGMNYIHEMLKSGKGFGPSGLGAATSGMVELSPYDRMLLETIAERTGFSLTGTSLQAVVNGANANGASRRAV